MKVKYIFLCSLLSIIMLGGVVFYITNHKDMKNDDNGRVEYVNAMFEFDTSTLEKAMGVSDYVFLAKINEIVRTEYKYPVEMEVGIDEYETVYTPYTFYNISVIKNIKGNLPTDETIELMQFGGLNYDKESYTFLKGGSLLEVGEYYILMPSAIEEDGDIEVADPNRIKHVENIEKMSSNEYSLLLEKYEEAYKNQIVPIRESTGTAIVRRKSKYDLD